MGLVLSLLVLLGHALTLLGLRANRSDSIPAGLYWLRDTAPRPGSYVAYCPADTPVFRQARERGYLLRGDCPAGTQPLFKVLSGQYGDDVAIDPDGVRINGVLLPDSEPRTADRAEQPLPDLRGYRRTLERDEVFLMSERCERGFDSRYFGPVERHDLLGTLIPLWQR